MIETENVLRSIESLSRFDLQVSQLPSADPAYDFIEPRTVFSGICLGPRILIS